MLNTFRPISCYILETAKNNAEANGSVLVASRMFSFELRYFRLSDLEISFLHARRKLSRAVVSR